MKRDRREATGTDAIDAARWHAGAEDGAALDLDDAHDDDADDDESDAATTAAASSLAPAAEPLGREEELELVRAAQRGDLAARDRLVRACQRNVAWIARRYRASGVPLDDLLNEGAIGVLTAIERFDTDRGVRFDTYARWWILDAQRQCVLQQSRTVRLPASVVREMGSVERLMRSEEAGAAPAPGGTARGSVIDRVAKRLRRSGSHVEELLALREPNLPMESLAERAHEDSEGEAVPRVTPWSPESTAAMRQILRHLGAVMAEGLSERERRVLVARYGLDTGEALSLEAIGEQLGLTAERVRQVQAEATAKLRALLVARKVL